MLVKVFAAAIATLLFTPAKAQQEKPNILVIWGDDIGSRQHQRLYPRHDGLPDAQHRPHRQGRCAVHRPYGQQCCTAGRAVVHPRPAPVPHRPADHRHAGVAARHSRVDADDRRPAEGRRATRPASSARTTSATATAPADGPRLRRILGNLYHLNAEEEPETYYYPKDPEFKKKYGPRGVLHTLADGKGGADDRGHRPADPERMETVDEEIMAAAPRSSSTRPYKDEEAVLRLVQHDAHARLDAPEAVRARARPASASIPTAWSSTTTWSAGCSSSSTTSGSPTTPSSSTPPTTAPRRCLGRTAAPHLLRRERHHLGRRLPRADDRTLAGRVKPARLLQRDSFAGGLAADAARRRG